MRLVLCCVFTALLGAAFSVIMVILILIMSSGAWWEKLWTDPNATFAGAVAIFTLGLVFVGYFQVKATRAQVVTSGLQYRATLALEAPNLFIPAIKLVEYANETTTVAVSDPVLKGMPNFCRILVLLTNSGRSNANITQGCLEWIVAPTLPPKPVYQHILQWHAILRRDEQIWGRFDPLGDVRLTPTQREEIEAGRSYLWTYGFFSYSDFKGSSVRRGFMGRWDIHQGFVREPSIEYEYQRES